VGNKISVIQTILTVVWGIAGMYNFYRAFRRLKFENKYIRRLLKENKELKEKVIKLETNVGCRDQRTA